METVECLLFEQEKYSDSIKKTIAFPFEIIQKV